MLTTDRDTQLDELLGTSIAGFDIPEDVYLRAVARYEDVGAWLANYWVESPVDGLVYPQGSFPLGTVVQPIDPRGTYDVDLVCRRDIAKGPTLPGDAARMIGDDPVDPTDPTDPAKAEAPRGTRSPATRSPHSMRPR